MNLKQLFNHINKYPEKKSGKEVLYRFYGDTVLLTTDGYRLFFVTPKEFKENITTNELRLHDGLKEFAYEEPIDQAIERGELVKGEEYQYDEKKTVIHFMKKDGSNHCYVDKKLFTYFNQKKLTYVYNPDMEKNKNCIYVYEGETLRAMLMATLVNKEQEGNMMKRKELEKAETAAAEIEEKERKRKLSEKIEKEIQALQKEEKEEKEVILEVPKKIEKLIELKGITIELVGSWYWISGETKKHKDTIKATGARYSAKRKKWYYYDDIENARRGRSSKKSYEEIKETYGYVSLKEED